VIQSWKNRMAFGFYRSRNAESPDEVVLGTVTYQPTTHNDSGQGTMTVSPSNTIDLGKYTKLVL
jgi:hypothetical protein